MDAIAVHLTGEVRLCMYRASNRVFQKTDIIQFLKQIKDEYITNECTHSTHYPWKLFKLNDQGDANPNHKGLTIPARTRDKCSVFLL